MDVNLCKNCAHYKPSKKYPHHTYCKKARTITSDKCSHNDCPHYTEKMDKETALQELSALDKQRFNDWFDGLPARTQFIALASDTKTLRDICAEWYIHQNS